MGMEELVFSGDRASVWKDETYPKVDGGEGYTTPGMYSMPLNGTPKELANLKR